MNQPQFKDARGHPVVVGMSVIFAQLKNTEKYSNSTMLWGTVTKINPVTVSVKLDDGTYMTKHPHKVVVASLPMIGPKTVRCRIQRYDIDVTEPPLEFVTLGEVDVIVPDNDYLGEQFAENLSVVCYNLRLSFKSYSMSSDPDFKYDVTVL